MRLQPRYQPWLLHVIHSFQLEQRTFLSFTSQKFCINYMLPPICGCYSSDSERWLPNVLFHIWKLVVCFEVVTEREKERERISAWQILSDSVEALANISVAVFVFYFPFRWKLENTFLCSTDHTHFPCTHSLYNQKEFFYVKILKTLFNSDVDKFLMWCVISVFLVVFEKW